MGDITLTDKYGMIRGIFTQTCEIQDDQKYEIGSKDVVLKTVDVNNSF